MSNWHLAQINVGELKRERGDPVVQPFFDVLDEINALAEKSPGFVWRLEDETGNATGIQIAPEAKFILNMSVWEGFDALFNFVYRSQHTPVMARRKDWFEHFGSTYQALWWVPAGHTPTIDEAIARLWVLEKYGPSPRAFHFKARFDPE